MKLGILIGFRYSREKELPHIDSDLDVMMKYCNDHDIDNVVITDMDIEYKREKYLYTNKDNLIFILENLLDSQEEILLYYTGHASRDNLHLPNGDYLETELLTDLIRKRTSPNARIFSIFDCCYGACLDLSFALVHRDIKFVGGMLMSQKVVTVNDTTKYIRAEMDKVSKFTIEIIKLDLSKLIKLETLQFMTIKMSHPSIDFLL